MTDEWKVLRGRDKGKTERVEDDAAASRGFENAPQDYRSATQPDGHDRYGRVTDVPPGAPLDSSLGAGGDETRYATVGYQEESVPPPVSSSVQEPLPKSHIIIGLCLLALVGFGWLFRSEVRGVASWAVSAAQGKKVPLSAKAPKLSRLLRFNSPYTWEEFLAVCGEDNPIAVRNILEKQPEFTMSPDGTPLLHALVSRSVNLHVLRAVTGKMDKETVNATDKDGKTVLHIAAGSNAEGAVLLVLRGLGADPSLRDKAGRLPLEDFLETWGGMPRSATSEEKGKFSRYGFNVPLPFSRLRDGTPKTKFVSIADQVDGMEGKRYFTLVAEARVTAREAGFSLPTIAAGDLVGPPPNEEAELMRSFGQDPMTRMRERNRTKADPMWKAIRLADGTGAAMAKFKCLYPECYPSTITYVSALLAGKSEKLSLEAEWSGWDVPALVRMAVAMQALQQRLAKSGKNKSNPLGGNAFSASSVSRAMYERGDSPQSRNPVLMAWTLLEIAKPDPSLPAANLDFSAIPPGKHNGKGEKGEKDGSTKEEGEKIRESENLRTLHSVLPAEVWRKVGRHLVAAAYVVDKRREGEWGAGMMPDGLKRQGGLARLRLWGNTVPSDQAEPLRAVLEATPSLPPEAAKGMVALILRTGPASTAPGKDGRTPLKFAMDNKLSEEVIGILREGPAYFLPPPSTSGADTDASGGLRGAAP